MPEAPSSFPCFWVERLADGAIRRSLRELTTADLPADGVLIQTQWSSLNYKDGLAAQGHPGVARHLPHIPGIDGAGVILESDQPDWPVGTRVLVTGYELGAGRWGGWSGQMRVPSEWLVRIPEGLSAHDAMAWGTAGFTAAQSVGRLQSFGITPTHGPIAVSGATGGVGSLSVALLAHLGYRVIAFTGKPEATAWLKSLGAAEVHDRRALLAGADEIRNRPLNKAAWIGAIDTVGGPTLTGLLRATDLHGVVTACGMVGGNQLDVSIFPFILRGISLCGITSQNCPAAERREIWEKLATTWRIPTLTTLTRDIEFAQLENWVAMILEGKVQGRIAVRIGKEQVTTRSDAAEYSGS